MTNASERDVEIVDGKIGPFQLEPGQHYRFLVRRPRLARVDFSALRFAQNSALLVPSSHNDDLHPLTAIVRALGYLVDEPSALLVIVGHASPDDTVAPGPLSQDRADSVLTLLQGERDAWVKIATRAGSLADIIAYLNYLAYERGWSCYAGEPRKDENENSRRGVGAFQGEYNDRFDGDLLRDGVCGENTLGAVFDVLRFELDRWLEKHGLPASAIRLHDAVPTLAAGSDYHNSPHLPLPDEPDFRRIVDLVLVDPAQLDGQDPSAERLYGAAAPAFSILDVPDEPGGWEYGTVLAYLPAADPAAKTAKYQLKSAAGDYDRTLVAALEGVKTGEHLEMRFDEVPVDAELTMLVHDGSDTHVLYKDVPYANLEDIDPISDDEILEPVLDWKEADE